MCGFLPYQWPKQRSVSLPVSLYVTLMKDTRKLEYTLHWITPTLSAWLKDCHIKFIALLTRASLREARNINSAGSDVPGSGSILVVKCRLYT